MNIARDFLSRCPACYSNFVHFWCTFACSVKQKQFVTIKAERTDQFSTIYNDTPESYATDVDIFVSKNYAEKIFESCKEVKFSNGYALDALCGESQRTCTYKKWFNFMGRYDGKAKAILTLLIPLFLKASTSPSTSFSISPMEAPFGRGSSRSRPWLSRPTPAMKRRISRRKRAPATIVKGCAEMTKFTLPLKSEVGATTTR